MGMAASQARLLAITSRIHDVELAAQFIQAAKIQLATQEDEVYREYNEALDATTLTFKTLDLATGYTSTVGATFNNLCSKDRALAATGNNYALRNKDGKLIVEDDVYETYSQEEFNSAYEFAIKMLGYNEAYDINDAENAVYSQYNTEDDALTNIHNQLEEYVEKYGSDDIYSVEADISESDDPDKTQDLKKYRELFKQYQATLYNKHAWEVFGKATQNEDYTEENFDNNSFNYYVNIYQQIKACGGCISIDETNANDSEWLQAMVQSGQITIEEVIQDKKTNDITMRTASPSSDSNLTYTPTSTIDKTALAKAEAKYEHDMKLIDKKDKQYDLTLSKLETERTALTTEYDSVKKVISDNIERTFGIFS